MGWERGSCWPCWGRSSVWAGPSPRGRSHCRPRPPTPATPPRHSGSCCGTCAGCWRHVGSHWPPPGPDCTLPGPPCARPWGSTWPVGSCRPGPTSCWQAQAELWEPLWSLLSDLRFLGAHVRWGALEVLPHSLGLLREAQQRGAVAAVGLEEVAAVVEATLELAQQELYAVGQREEANAGQEEAAVGQEELAVGQEDLTMGQEDLAMGQEDLAVGQEDLTMGQEDLAMGQEDLAVGQDLTMGQEDLTMGQEDLAMGQEDLAVGQEDLAVGWEDPAVGLLVGLAQEAANAPPSCPLRAQVRDLLPPGHRLLLRPLPDPGTRPPDRWVLPHSGPGAPMGVFPGRLGPFSRTPGPLPGHLGPFSQTPGPLPGRLGPFFPDSWAPSQTPG
ncbi:uncharacterized protein LOC112964013, partial [Apteryx rowi]|uniref:uncharacterized protein LOC112964013 n=1 Tax=Apteryx rowi TaxID=308060 RepID=UPI000E1DEE83